VDARHVREVVEQAGRAVEEALARVRMDDGSGCREIIWRSVNGAYVLERPIQGSSSVVDLCTAAMPRIASCVSGSSLSKAAAMSANSVSPGHDAGTRAARSMPIAGGLTQPLTSVW